MFLSVNRLPFLNILNADISAHKRGRNKRAVKSLSVPVSGAKLRTSEL